MSKTVDEQHARARAAFVFSCVCALSLSFVFYFYKNYRAREDREVKPGGRPAAARALCAWRVRVVVFTITHKIYTVRIKLKG